MRARFAWTDRTKPRAPRVAVRGRNRTVSVSWSKPVENGSGVAHYEITVDGRPPTEVAVARGRTLRLGGLARGQHRVSVAAIDRAGNRGAPGRRTFDVR